MRIWSKGIGLQSNSYIANIPEHPNQNDFFNISKLLACDGRMSTRWINIYGPEPSQRGQRTKGRAEGSCWLGRVLLAFNLMPYDSPVLALQSSNALKEPLQGNFLLWVDIYELIDFTYEMQDNEQLFVIVSQGQYRTEKDKSIILKQRSTNQYYLSQKQIPTIESEFPKDYNQIPDIFIDFYCNPGSDPINRVGYIRIKAIEVAQKKPNPQWRVLKSPYNDQNQNKLGQVMINVQFQKKSSSGQNEQHRLLLEKGAKQVYKFYYQIFNGFELATSIPYEQLDTSIQIDIGNVKGDKCCTEYRQGHYPIWNQNGDLDVQMLKELSFQPDMKITLCNKIPGQEFPKQLGGFCVNIRSIQNKCDKPQFFNIINEHGSFIGQILANFYVQYIPKNNKDARNKNSNVNELHHQNQDFFNKYFAQEDLKKFTLQFSLLGIRNLLKEASNPVATVWLTNNEADKREMRANDEGSYHQSSGYIKTCNPTFGNNVTFDDVQLSIKHPLLWPFLVVQVHDERKNNALFGEQKDYIWTTIPLIHYAKNDLDKEVFKYSKAQFSRNQKHISYIQEQIDPQQFIKKLEVSSGSESSSDLDEEESDAEGSDEQETVDKLELMNEINNKVSAHFRKSQMKNGIVMKQVTNTAQSKIKKKLDAFALFEGKDTHEDVRDTIDKFYDIARKSLMGIDQNPSTDLYFGEDENEKDDDDLAVHMDGEEQVQNNDLDSGIAIGFYIQQLDQKQSEKNSLIQMTSIEDIYVGKFHKKRENKFRDMRIQQIKNEMKYFLDKISQLQASQDYERRVYQMHLHELQEEQDELLTEIMTEQKFWGVNAALEEEDQEFDYGRDILRKENYDELIERKSLPFENIPLFLKTQWQQYANIKPLTVQIKGIMRSGVLSKSIMKAKIKMMKKDELESNVPPNLRDLYLFKSPNDFKNQDQQDKKDNQGDAKYIQNIKLVDKVQKDLNFKIEEPSYMKVLTDQYQKNYKIRVYLLSGQNISAMNNLIDLKSRLAGMYAMCTSDPYPKLIVGSGQIKNEKDKKLLKFINGREFAIPGELNPQFLKMFELDAQIPEDLFLEIQIFDRQDQGIIADKLIGSTFIDIENRRLGNKLFLCKEAAVIELDKLKNNKIKDQDGFKLNLDQKRELQSKQVQKQTLINDHKQKIGQIDQLMQPIEFREIFHPNKLQAQGVLEMFTEVLTVEESRSIQQSKIRTVAKQVYEIRVIIWETRDVPLDSKDQMSLLVKCTFDPTGWSQDEITKTTDTHMNSKDGYGVFNWRMKFDISVPCEFPRLKFEVQEAGIASNESIGTASINLKKTMNKLKKEEKISVPKSYISLHLPKFNDESRGLIMFSMDILLKEDANQDPVGEAQSEPNKNPKLKTPTAGRGLGDAMASIGISMPTLSWNPFGNYIYIIAFFGVLGIILTFAVLLK